jgi:hypothetical protein
MAAEDTTLICQHAGRKYPGKGRFIRLSLALLSAVVLSSTVGGAAFAGTNGQQVIVVGTAQYSAQICGYNQNNDYVCTGYISTPNPETPVSGSWWVGTITIYGWTGNGASGRYLGSASCDVPSFQWFDDWTKCYTGW